MPVAMEEPLEVSFATTLMKSVPRARSAEHSYRLKWQSIYECRNLFHPRATQVDSGQLGRPHALLLSWKGWGLTLVYSDTR